MEFIKSLCLGGITTTMLLSGCTQKNITLEGKVTNFSQSSQRSGVPP